MPRSSHIADHFRVRLEQRSARSEAVGRQVGESSLAALIHHNEAAGLTHTDHRVYQSPNNWPLETIETGIGHAAGRISTGSPLYPIL